VRFRASIILIFSLICFWPAVDSAWAADIKPSVGKPSKKVVVKCTGYYKPRRDQKVFARKNYNSEIKLNGKGQRTSSGSIPKIGTIAADPKVFPVGTKIFVPGYGQGIVEDTGSRIKGLKIDLFMGEGADGLRKATDWGRRRLAVEVAQN
jgi:3D (Asp-Asp-Asp) domain-containing protein